MDDMWSVVLFVLVVDEVMCCLVGDMLCCLYCGGFVWLNILMFGDIGWFGVCYDV